jgi:hypothetical protein
MAFASGYEALGICDICGFSCKFVEMREYIFNQVPNGLKVCPTCFDIDNLQLQVGKHPKEEAIALLRPRPDSGIPFCRGFFGWYPVIGLQAQFTLGEVTVE